MNIKANVLELIGNTPLVRVSKVLDGAQGGPGAEARVAQPAVQREGPHRVLHDRGRGEEGPAEEGQRHRGAHQRQHGHRAGVHRRVQGLPLHPHDAGEHEHRAAQASEGVRRRAGAHPGAAGDEGRGREGQGDPGIHAPVRSCPSSSRTRPIPRSTARPPRRRSGRTPTARWTSSSAGVGTGGTITGVSEFIKKRKPSFKVDRGGAGQVPPALGRDALAAQDPGNRRGLHSRAC